MAAKNLKALEDSYLNKLKTNPNDEGILRQLLLFYVDTGELYKAHCLAFNYWGNSVLEQSAEWHRCLKKVYEACLESDSDAKTMEDYLIGAIFSLDKHLTVLHRSRKDSTLDETVSVLQSFDKLLWKLCCISNPREISPDMKDHFCGQLAHHIAVVLLRKSAQERSPKDEAVSLSSLALLFAQKLGSACDIVVTSRHVFCNYPFERIDKLKCDANYRIIQANLTLRNWSASTSQHEFVIRGQIYSKEIRERIFRKIFPSTEVKADLSTWLSAGVFETLPTTLPAILTILSDMHRSGYKIPTSEDKDLCAFMSSCNYSLHDFVWLGVQSLILKIFNTLSSPSLRSKISQTSPILHSMFNSWDVAQLGNMSFQNPVTKKKEILSSVDIDTFLYLTIYSCYFAVKNNIPSLLLSDAMPLLPTDAQCQFWNAVWKLQNNKLDTAATEILMKGLQTVRLIGQHGLDLELLISVARTLICHAENVLQPCFKADISSVKNRALLFWRQSIEQLKALRQNQACVTSKNFFFPRCSKFSEMNPAEIDKLIKEGCHFVSYEDDSTADVNSWANSYGYNEGEKIANAGQSYCSPTSTPNLFSGSNYGSYPQQPTLGASQSFSLSPPPLIPNLITGTNYSSTYEVALQQPTAGTSQYYPSLPPIIPNLITRSNYGSGNEMAVRTNGHLQGNNPQVSLYRSEPSLSVRDANLEKLVELMEKMSDRLESLEKIAKLQTSR